MIRGMQMLRRSLTFIFVVAMSLALPLQGAHALTNSQRVVLFKKTVSTFTPTSPQSSAFLARTSGLSLAQKQAYDTMITGMVSDGTWTLLDALYIFATNNTTTAALNLVSTSFTITPHGTLTFTAGHGWAGDGSTGYLDTTFNPSTAPSPKFSPNSASIGVYDQTSPGSSNSGGMGITDGTNLTRFALGGAGASAAWIEIESSNPISLAVGNNRNAWVVTRTAQFVQSAYRNGSSTALGTNAGDSQSNPSLSFYIGAVNTSGSPALFGTDQLSAAFIGGGLTGAQSVLINNRINAFMTAFGVNVY